MALEQPKYAQEIFGQSRAKWFFRDKSYTAAGVEVPPAVMAEDEERYAEEKDVAPDDQVLDMKVTLPADALPPGRHLAPIDGLAPDVAQPVDPAIKTTTAPPKDPPVVSDAVAQQKAARGQKT